MSGLADILRAGACLAAAGPALGRAVLDAAPKSAPERAAALNFLHEGERCLHLTTSISTSIARIRGAAAESLYEVEFATPVTARTPPVAAKPMTRPPAPAAGAPDLGPVYALVECAAPAHPELVRRLMASDPQTPAEQAARDALVASFRPCVTPGVRFEVDSSGLRSLLAEAVYRWSVVQRDGPASPWAADPAAAAPAPAPAATPAPAAPGH